MIKKLNSDNFKSTLENSEKPCVVKFYSKDCYLCRGLAPVFDSVAHKYANRLNFYIVDSNKEAALSEPYLDGGVPTIQVFYKDIPSVLIEYPEEPNQVSGYSRDYLDQWLYFYLVSYSVIKGSLNND